MSNSHSFQHKTLRFETLAHYFTMGTPSPSVRQFWIICHGYAQLADEFLTNFALLDHPNFFVLAPEATNYFYKKGFDGDVAACWMTRRHRREQIINYANFLQKIYEKYIPLLPADVRIVLLGFSQGAATVCRWIFEKQPHFHDLLLWAGLPPEDLDYSAHAGYLSDKNLYLLRGTVDPFLTPDRMSTLHEIEQKNNIDFVEKQFDGGHEITADALRNWLHQLN